MVVITPDLVLLEDIGIIILAATILAYLASFLRQPKIPAYILAGMIIGPLGLGLITNQGIISTLSELGIAFLLFIVGMEIDLRRLKDIGIFSVIGGSIQVSAMFVLGFLASTAFGFSNLEGIYIGLALALSSTMVVIKLLSDRNQLDTLHGRLTLGILLVQDLIIVLALSLLPNIGGLSINPLVMSIFKAIGLISISIVFSKYILPVIFRYATRSQELLFMTAVAMSFLFAGLAMNLGFSPAIGAFIAGVGLASFPYNLEIIGRIRSLRDFFSTIFFVSLGMQINFMGLGAILFPLLAFVFLVIIVKPIITTLLCILFGYEDRTSFFVGVELGQISEFSLILMAMGVSLGHISPNLLSITTVIAIITMTLTVYFIKYDNTLYKALAGHLFKFISPIPVKSKKVYEHLPRQLQDHVVIFGCHRMGLGVVTRLKKLHKDLIVVDYNPDVIQTLIQEGIPCMYGDMGNMEILERLNFENAKFVISTVSTEAENTLLIEVGKAKNPNLTIIVRAHTYDGALRLYHKGADYVIIPEQLGGKTLTRYSMDLINHTINLKRIRENHIDQLREIERELVLRKFSKSFLYKQ